MHLLRRAGLAKDLVMQLEGFISEEKPGVRNLIFDEIETRIPKDAQVRVWIYTGELAQHANTGWHFHNGPCYFVLLKGRLVVETKDDKLEFKAGQVYAEPIGVIHRAYNPDDSTPAVAIAFQITP